MAREVNEAIAPKKRRGLVVKSTAELEQQTLLRPIEAIKLFGISASKFWHWAGQNNFALLRPDGPQGKVIYVRRLDIQQFIETGKPVAAQAA